MSAETDKVRDLLLVRRGVIFVDSRGQADPRLVRALGLELAAIGYVLSTRLTARLAQSSTDELISLRRWALDTLLAHIGGNQKHQPLFRRFPDGVPRDTETLYWQRVLVHFFQTPSQPCLFCRRISTTHVLSPCRHVVCDRCFDGSNYSACPVCNRAVDQSSPFFQPAEPRRTPRENVRFKLLDLGEDFHAEAQSLFSALAERAQAMSPQDVDALRIVVSEAKSKIFSWLPAKIPVRENIAHIFGTLFRLLPSDEVLPHAKKYLRTATDVLRFIAVISSADPALLGETRHKQVPDKDGKLSSKAFHIKRFKMAKLTRAMRRFILALLDAIPFDNLAEDMLRHRSYWIWAGEFLHPGEYAQRFSNMARAFQVLRDGAVDGEARFRTWKSRVVHALEAKQTLAAAALLSTRPGELARSYDHLLRVDQTSTGEVAAIFGRHAGAMATPVLLTLYAHLPARAVPAAVRVYWPKSKVALGVYDQDRRPPLSGAAIAASLEVIRAELLARFEKKPRFSRAIVDRELASVIVPFNERTSARAAVSLPRGSRIDVPAGKLLRLFLHWCEPEAGGHRSDLDLSVGFYDAAWKHTGVCSYYNLKLIAPPSNQVVATSSGDLTSAPYPNGASEFVDLDREKALAAGMRYAVFVVNNYSGMAFSALERGFAGIMYRDDRDGKHFDPRTVELKFSIEGENGIFLPLVLDLESNSLHWLDVHARGSLQFNNVASSNREITTICPSLIEYFGSKTRPSMQTLALLHAAARSESIYLRGDTTQLYRRRAGETAIEFHDRILRGEPDEDRAQISSGDSAPILAALYRGNIDLPRQSAAYALFRESVTPNLAAADLLS